MEKSQKILIFSTAYYPFVGGAEVAIKEITDRIPNIQFDLITAKLSKTDSARSLVASKEKIGNVNVYRLGLGIPILDKLLLPFWGAIKAINLNKKNNYCSYWCMMVTFASGAAYIANIFSRIKIPIILTLQEGDSEEYLKTKWLGLIDLSWRLALKKSTIVTVISNYLSERARRLGYEGEIKVIPNGVDIEKYSEIFSEQELNELREKLSYGENAVILMSTSRLTIKNGLDLVIRALKFLPENFHFYNFGSGREKNHLLELAKSLGVSTKVHLQDYVDHNELPKYLKVADIFIRPSRSEGMGNSFLEAMAAKIPVIATPVGGIVDFLMDPEKLEQSEIRNGMEVQTGYFCESENPESIAKTVQRITTDSNRKNIIENAYKMVCENYDWNKITLQIKHVFIDQSNFIQ